MTITAGSILGGMLGALLLSVLGFAVLLAAVQLGIRRDRRRLERQYREAVRTHRPTVIHPRKEHQ